MLPELDKIYQCFVRLWASFLLHGGGGVRCSCLPFAWEEMSWHAPDRCTPNTCIDMANSDFPFHPQEHMCRTKASTVLASSLSNPTYHQCQGKIECAGLWDVLFCV